MSYQFGVLALAISIISMIGSQVLIKYRFLSLGASDLLANNFVLGLMTLLKDKYIWIGAALIVLSAASWYTALARLPLSQMMPMAALIMPSLVLAGALFFGETLNAQKIAAIALIVTGVVWLGLLQARSL